MCYQSNLCWEQRMKQLNDSGELGWFVETNDALQNLGLDHQ